MVDSFSGKYLHVFDDLAPGEYDIVLDALNNGNVVLNAGAHNGAPKSNNIIWPENFDKLHVTIREGDTSVIRRFVFLALKAYGFKTVTDVGTFSANPSDSIVPGAPSADGKEYVYYPVREGGNNWDFENPDADTVSYAPYVHSHIGIFHGEPASRYRGMTQLQVPTLSAEEEAKEYEFLGWQLEGDESGKIYMGEEALQYAVRQHTVFKALWNSRYVTVSFEANGGDGDMPSVQLEKGSDYTLPDSGFTPPAGKVFDGWDKGTVGSVLKNIMEDTVLTAKWADDGGDDAGDEDEKGDEQYFTIVFDPNGGKMNGSTKPQSKKVSPDEVIIIPAAPEREGYRFLYWEGSEYHPGEEYIVKEDHTFTAKWEKVEETTQGFNQPDNKQEDNKQTENKPAEVKEPEQQTEIAQPEQVQAETNAPQDHITKTGDTKHPILWLSMLMLSVTGLMVFRKRYKKVK